MKEDSSDRGWGKQRDGPETTKVFTPSLSQPQSLLKLNKQYSVPVINQIAAENEHLTQQRETISKEMGKVASLGQYLAKQNERLRLHYHQRTCDVSHIIKTMQINTFQNLTEVQHQIHLLRESNCLIFKKIQEQSQQFQNSEAIIGQKNGNLSDLQRDNVETETEKVHPLKAKLANKYNTNYIYELENKRNQYLQKQHELLEQVENLILQTNRLRKNNIQNSEKIKNGNVKNKNEKESYRGDIVHVLKTLSELKEERENLKLTAERQKMLNYEKEKMNESAKQNLSEIKLKLEQHILETERLKFTSERYFQKIRQGKKSNAELEIEIEKEKDKKANLQKQLQKRKNKIKENDLKFREVKTKIDKEKQAKILQYKKKIYEVDQSEQQDLKKLKEDSSGFDSRIQGLIQSYRSYDSDIHDYGSLLSKLENPVSQIQRAQMILRLQGKRQGLQNLSRF